MKDELGPQTVRENSEDTSTNDPNQKASGDTNVATLGGSDKFALEKQKPEGKLLELEAPREGRGRFWLFRKS